MTSCRTASQHTLGTKTSTQMALRDAFHPSVQVRGSSGPRSSPSQVKLPSPLPSPPLVTRQEVTVYPTATRATHDAPQTLITKALASLRKGA